MGRDGESGEGDRVRMRVGEGDRERGGERQRGGGVVFTRPDRRCCTCSAYYRLFLLIGVFVRLVDVTALFLVMWPSS